MEKSLKAVLESNPHAIVPIPPHGGGLLVNRLLGPVDAKKLGKNIGRLPSIDISSANLCDIEMLAIGAYSPLDGFMDESAYTSVVRKGRLPNGLLWPIPITLMVNEETKQNLRLGLPAVLAHDDEAMGIIHVESLYQPDKKMEVAQVFKTTDAHHPGVAEVLHRGSWYVGGRVDIWSLPERLGIPPYNLTPRDTRRLFWEKKWGTIVGFQTRNPMHRGHEAITKKALEGMDGLLIHPLVGETKEGDFPAEMRMRCCEALINHYFPADKVILAALPGRMYFAGPREAILHAIIRQNYGCTHFIVGRDHAGVGSYYGVNDARELINWFSREDLAIQPVFPDATLPVSGSRIRELIRAGIPPPPEMMRPEVAAILMSKSKS